MNMELLGTLVGELGKLGIQIFQSIQSGNIAEWTPIVEKLSPEIQVKLYHELRMAQLGKKLDDVLPR